MSKSFIKDAEPLLVPAKYARRPDDPNILWALTDLKREGINNLNEIAADYGISTDILRGRYYRDNHAA